MKKLKWDDTELSLARCLNFAVDETSQTIRCDISVATKKSLFEFFKKCFVSLVESPAYEKERERIFSEIKRRYNLLWDSFNKEVLPKIKTNGYSFYNHQKEAMFYCYNKQYNLLAMDMGTGKTLVSASLSKLWNIQRTIVICPSVVKWNWYRDLTDKFGFNKLYFTILDRIKSKSITAFVDERFIIVNYEMIEKFWDKITENSVGHIICDEAHMLKNHNSNRFENVSKLAALYPAAKITLLSGTPVKNRVNDMFAYLKLTKHPLGKNYSYFLRQYTNTEFGRGGLRVTGSKNLDDLYSKLSNFMVRYRLEDAVDMPEKIINKYYFELGDYKKEYNDVIDQMLEENERFDVHGSLATLNIVVSRAKLKGIIELAKNIIEEGRKVVIFSSYHAPLDDMQIAFKDNSVRVDGRIDAFEKDKQIQRFWNEEGINIFLGQTSASGVGINLTNCHDVIFANFPFTIADMEQGISRCYRIGQKNKVKVYLPIALDSIDEFIYDMLVDKSKDINQLVDKGKTGVTNYASIESELFKKLMEQYNKTDILKDII